MVKDVPAYSVVGGNPARVIKRRFNQDIVDRLLEIAWWNWKIEKITANLDKIVAADIDALLLAED